MAQVRCRAPLTPGPGAYTGLYAWGGSGGVSIAGRHPSSVEVLPGPADYDPHLPRPLGATPFGSEARFGDAMYVVGEAYDEPSIVEATAVFSTGASRSAAGGGGGGGVGSGGGWTSTGGGDGSGGAVVTRSSRSLAGPTTIVRTYTTIGSDGKKTVVTSTEAGGPAARSWTHDAAEPATSGAVRSASSGQALTAGHSGVWDAMATPSSAGGSASTFQGPAKSPSRPGSHRGETVSWVETGAGVGGDLSSTRTLGTAVRSVEPASSSRTRVVPQAPAEPSQSTPKSVPC
jgi:hypothetical protein